MGRKNFNIFREKNNNQIEKFHDSVIDPKTGQRRANIFYSIYDEEIKRQKVLDEIELFII